jgi:hypothetical protein
MMMVVVTVVVNDNNKLASAMAFSWFGFVMVSVLLPLALLHVL